MSDPRAERVDMKLVARSLARAEEPDWVACGRCGQQYTRLADLERQLCIDCVEHDRREAMRPTRESVLEVAGYPLRFRLPAGHPDTYAKPEPWPASLPTDWTGEPWLIFTGPVGSGKTMLATEALWRWMLRQGPPYRGQWVRAATIIEDLYGQPDRGARATQRQRYVAAPVLLVDDLGRHERGAWVPVSEVLAERYDWMRPTILTTNLKFEVLAELDPSLYSRLRDAIPVAVMGRDRRGVDGGAR